MVDEIITDKSILKQISVETTWEEVELLNLIKRLREANKTAWTDGCGLSAIQIGIPLRFAWFLFKDKEYTLMNPKIITKIGTVNVKEGCLSIPDFWAQKNVAYEIEYISDGKKKKAKGFKAQIIQHEMDHMDGRIIA